MKLDLIKMKKISATLFAMIGFTSCLNNDDELQPVPDQSFGVFINASPGPEGLRFYFDDVSIHTNTIEYTEHIGYVGFTPGNKSLTVRSENNNILDTINLNMLKDKGYSIFAVNYPNNVELVAYDDSHMNPSGINTVIRFIQLSPDIPQVRLEIQASDEFFGEFNFKQATPFREIDEVLNRNLYLIDVVTSDTILTKEVDFERGGVYSIFSKGLLNTDNQTYKLDLQVDKIN